MHTAASDKALCTQNTTFCGRLGDAWTQASKNNPGSTRRRRGEVIVDRLLGQDDGAHSACPLAQQLELGGLEVIPVQGPDGRFSLPFAAMHESGIGPSRHFACANN